MKIIHYNTMTIYNLQYNMARSPAPDDKDLGFGPGRDGLTILVASGMRAVWYGFVILNLPVY